MASRIAGITIEIGGDTSKFQKALTDIDKVLGNTQSQLKDVNKLLKLDPSNTELLTQKQKALETAIQQTGKRLDELKAAQATLKKGSEEWDAYEREIIATEQKLKSLEKQQREFGSVAAQQIKAAGKAMQDFGKKVTEAGKKFQPLSTAATGALTALGGLAYKSVTSADELNTLAKQTGFTTEEIQKMQYASDLVDVSFDDMAGALKKLKPKISEDNEALAALGVSITNADGSLRDANDVFFDTVEALSHIDNETERDQAAMELFGKSADSLAGIIDDGGAALKEYGAQAEQLGLIMDGETIDALNEVNDTLDTLKANTKGSLAKLGATLAQTLAPVLEKVTTLMDRISEKLASLTPQQTETIMKILAVVAAIGPVLTIGGKIITMLGSAVSVIGTVVGVLGGPLTIAIGAVIAVGVLLYKNWDKIKAKAQQICEAIKDKWNDAKESVSTAVSNLKDNVKSAWNGIKSAVSGVVDNIKGKIDSFKKKFDELKDKVKTTVDKLKGFLDFKWNLPTLKLPHIKLEKGEWPWGIMGEGKKPTVKIEWYKKAYQNPVMFSSPTVMATPSGYKGFGDGHGAEIVMGLDKLRELVGAQANGVTINVYASDGMDVNALADKIQDRFIALNHQRRAAYA